jgi:protein-disulfide isomerase
MRTLVACLLGALVACASRAPTARSPASPAAPSTALKFPARDTTSAPSLLAQPSEVERIYGIPSTAGAPSLGSLEAKVTIEVCSDFQCPYCAQLVPTLHELHQNYEELLRIVWRNCPLPIHEHALAAAEAALEVQAQRGDGAFWAYHDALFTHQNDLSLDALLRHARAIDGVDVERVRAALHDHRHLPHVQQEITALIDSGAASDGLGTPVSFINGRRLVGVERYETFEDAVERALQEQPEARLVAEAQSKAAYPMARVRHILVQYRGSRGAEPSVTRSKQEAQQRAESLRARVTYDRSAFAALASQESDCPSKQQGGELGRFTQGDLEPHIEVALFVLEPGQVSEVVESPFGFHVLLREE